MLAAQYRVPYRIELSSVPGTVRYRSKLSTPVWTSTVYRFERYCPIRAVLTSPPTDWYADCRLPGRFITVRNRSISTIAAHYQAVSAEEEEIEEEGEPGASKVTRQLFLLIHA
ncbi:hypothetical protein BHE74_00021135 [Ensete ventricosum]|nr:hypothetical protein BHE74_00021135 [Ensete ventricosum]RZR85447.1 hypothetical protein BHM03_00012427 [Ensete ventricosum]